MNFSEMKKIYLVCILFISFFTYSIFLYYNLPNPNHIASIKAQSGKLIWQKHNCNSCHQIYGQGGFIGPDITNSYSTRGPEYIRNFIKQGTSTMPSFSLSTFELNELLSFLQHIDSSGSADPRTFKTYIYGIAKQK